MDKDFQAKFRTDLYEKYQKLAFEAFAMYTYWGNRLEQGSKDVDKWEASIKDIEQKIAALRASPEAENRKEGIAALKGDIALYRKNITGLEPVMKKLFEKISTYRQEALELLEQAEYIKEFKLATIEEIKEKKDKDAAPAVAPEAAPEAQASANPQDNEVRQS